MIVKGAVATERRQLSRPVGSGVTSAAVFFGIIALLFVVSATATVIWCTSMSAMGRMSMQGGSWPAVASFMGMWFVMMLAMMLPSLTPMLWRYRRAVGRVGDTRVAWLTALAGAGYFVIWIAFGMVAYAVGTLLATAELQPPELARVVPIAVAGLVLIVGALQFTPWKVHYLTCCRESPGRGRAIPAEAPSAWRHGLRLGRYCSACSGGLVVILLATGVMNVWVMAVVTAAITFERLAPVGKRAAQGVGVCVIGAGVFLVSQAVGFA